MIDRLLTAADLAKIFSVSEQKVMEWNRVYKWPVVKIGRRFRWTPEMVEQIVAQHRDSGKTLRVMPGQTQRSASRGRASP